jgi:hypothetical protein
VCVCVCVCALVLVAHERSCTRPSLAQLKAASNSRDSVKWSKPLQDGTNQPDCLFISYIPWPISSERCHSYTIGFVTMTTNSQKRHFLIVPRVPLALTADDVVSVCVEHQSITRTICSHAHTHTHAYFALPLTANVAVAVRSLLIIRVEMMQQYITLSLSLSLLPASPFCVGQSVCEACRV